MQDLQYRQQQFQAKRKATPWRDFILELASWVGLIYYKNTWKISIYPDSDRINTLVTAEEFAAHRDNQPFQSIDPSLWFFEQYLSLQQQIASPALNHVGTTENVWYAEGIISCRNCYLSNTIVVDCDTVLYSYNVKDNSSNVYNSVHVFTHCDTVFESHSITESSFIFYSSHIANSHNIWFSTHMIGCAECINCEWLENKSYCIENTEYTKEEYMNHKDTYIQKLLETPAVAVSDQPYVVQCSNCTWNDIVNCHDVTNIYSSNNTKTWNNVMYATSAYANEKFYDVFMAGRSDNFYWVAWAGIYSSHCYCSYHFFQSNNLYYCARMESCVYCLGCIWLINRSYCIFNKQYTKEERHQKVDEIFGAMEKEGILGDFFPGWINPYYFNDTTAYLLEDNFTKEEVTRLGYLWRDDVIKVDIPEGLEVVKTGKLGEYEWWKDETWKTIRHPELDSGSPLIPWDAGSESGMTDSVWWIDPEILKKVIQDEQWNVYRIVKKEYEFLVKYGLPLPRLHWLDRLKLHLSMT